MIWRSYDWILERSRESYWRAKEDKQQGCLHDFSYYAKEDTEVHNIYVFEYQ
jgi:hypothetical protein